MPATTDPHPKSSPGLKALATISSQLRQALRETVEGDLHHLDTVHGQDDHVLTVADDGNGLTVLVLDGARIDLDDQEVADLCARLLRRTVAGNRVAHYRMRAALDLLSDLGPEPF